MRTVDLRRACCPNHGKCARSTCPLEIRPPRGPVNSRASGLRFTAEICRRTVVCSSAIIGAETFRPYGLQSVAKSVKDLAAPGLAGTDMDVGDTVRPRPG